MSRIGSKIFSLRNAKGLSRKQLAKTVGVSEKFIEEAETGRKVLSDELVKRIAKVLGQELDEVSIYVSESDSLPEKKNISAAKKVEKHEIQEIWNDAFESVLKAIPVYGYSLDKVLETKQLPVVSNKIDGFSKDKVLYLRIQDNDMIGFRMIKDDMAFGHITHEIENNSICLVEYDGKRVIRQLKKLDGDKLLLVYNNGRVITETTTVKNIKVLARLIRLEIKL